MIGGLATPFSLRKEPETASMVTLATQLDQRSNRMSVADSLSSFLAGPASPTSAAKAATEGPEEVNAEGSSARQRGSVVGIDPGETPGSATAISFATPLQSPTSPGERPVVERFVTAEEEVPKANS